MADARTIARRVHDSAKIKTWREITTRHPGEYALLRQGYLEHFYGLGLKSRQAHNRARQAAFADLAQIYPEEYLEIRTRWVAHFRELYEWKDERPDANRLHRKTRTGQPRSTTGQWIKKDHPE